MRGDPYSLPLDKAWVDQYFCVGIFLKLTKNMLLGTNFRSICFKNCIVIHLTMLEPFLNAIM